MKKALYLLILGVFLTVSMVAFVTTSSEAVPEYNCCLKQNDWCFSETECVADSKRFYGSNCVNLE